MTDIWSFGVNILKLFVNSLKNRPSLVSPSDRHSKMDETRIGPGDRGEQASIFSRVTRDRGIRPPGSPVYAMLLTYSYATVAEMQNKGEINRAYSIDLSSSVGIRYSLKYSFDLLICLSMNRFINILVK